MCAPCSSVGLRVSCLPRLCRKTKPRQHRYQKALLVVVNGSMTTGETGEIELKQVEKQYLPAVAELLGEAFGTKTCCCCFSAKESTRAVQKRYEKYPRAKWELGVVAVKGDVVLGFAQMSKMGLPMYPEGLHQCKRGEFYIETITVSGEARGKGIGGRLLKWCEDKARLHRGMTLALEVLQGNPAIHLYKRFGFEIEEVDFIENCCNCFWVLLLMGRPYGCRDRHFGLHSMVKSLRTQAESTGSS